MSITTAKDDFYGIVERVGNVGRLAEFTSWLDYKLAQYKVHGNVPRDDPSDNAWNSWVNNLNTPNLLKGSKTVAVAPLPVIDNADSLSDVSDSSVNKRKRMPPKKRFDGTNFSTMDTSSVSPAPSTTKSSVSEHDDVSDAKSDTTQCPGVDDMACDEETDGESSAVHSPTEQNTPLNLTSIKKAQANTAYICPECSHSFVSCKELEHHIEESHPSKVSALSQSPPPLVKEEEWKREFAKGPSPPGLGLAHTAAMLSTPGALRRLSEPNYGAIAPDFFSPFNPFAGFGRICLPPTNPIEMSRLMSLIVTPPVAVEPSPAALTRSSPAPAPAPGKVRKVRGAPEKTKRSFGVESTLCPDCKQMCSSVNELKSHMQVAHNHAGFQKVVLTGQDPQFVCKFCGKRFLSYGSTWRHVNGIHFRATRPCPNCHKAIGINSPLRLHWKHCAAMGGEGEAQTKVNSLEDHCDVVNGNAFSPTLPLIPAIPQAIN